MFTEIDTVKIPIWAIPFIEYGESDDLTPDEEKLVRDFLASFGDYDYVAFEYGQKEYFSHNNDIDGLGGTVVDAVVYGHPMTTDETRAYGPQGALK
jgi:predicted signal transduction protein with EAL and GGDEF domain